MSGLKQFLLMTLLMAGLNAVSAQEPNDQNQLTQELVTARIQTLRDSGSQEGAETTVGSYEAVLNWLGEAEVHAASERNYLQAQIDAPLQELEIRDRIESTANDAKDFDASAFSKLSKEELDRELAALRQKLRESQITKSQLDEKILSEQSSAPNIQARFEAIDTRLQELPSTPVTIDPGLQPSQFEASQWAILAERKALFSERRSLEGQLASQSVRYSRRKAESDELALIQGGLSTEISYFEKELASRAKDLESEDSISIDESTPGYGFVQGLLENNAQLREQSADLDTILAALKDTNQRIETQQLSLSDRFEGVKTLVSLSGNSASLGHVLMVHWHETDSFSPDEIQSVTLGEIGDHVIQRTRYEDTLHSLSNVSNNLASTLSSEIGVQESELVEQVVDTARSLLRSQRELLTALIASETELVNIHGSLERNRTRLNTQVADYQAYLGGRILWVPSHPPFTIAILTNIGREFGEFLSKFRELGFAPLTPGSSVLLALAGLLLLLRNKIDSRLRSINQMVGRVRDDSIFYTLRALILTVIRLMPAPLLLLLIANGLQSPNSDTAPYLATGIQDTIKDLLIILLIRTSCRENGVARTHFSWSEKICEELRQLSTWLLVLWFPLLVLTGFIFRVELNSINAVLGRLLFCAVMVIFTVILLRFSASGFVELQKRKRLRFWLMVLIVLNGLFFISSTTLGYLYSARLVYEAVVNSLALVVLLLFLYYTLQRWLLVVRRRLRFNELLAARQTSGESGAPEIEPEAITLVSLSESVSTLLKVVTITLAAFSLILIWAPFFRALEGMRQITLWTISDVSDGEAILTSITLASLVFALSIGLFTYLAARHVPPLLALVLRSRKNISPGTRYAIVKLFGYLVVTVGTFFVLSNLGLRWDRLQWLVAALGVGIGFGLQEIIANFISGLIILFERPIRVGDVISVGESSGQVIRIQIRATTIRDFDGKELLVPNKEFVTGRLLNWTLSDTSIRMTLDVGIAYGSDVQKAVTILQNVLEKHELIADEPEPDVIFSKFGDSSLNLTARYFFTEVNQRGQILSELHMRINDAFAEAGIVIAFPQLDLHLDRASETTPLTNAATTSS